MTTKFNLIVSSVLLLCGSNVARAENFTNCDATSYYSSLPADPTTWDMATLSKHLRDTHRDRPLPVQDKSLVDLYNALLDLWPSSQIIDNGNVVSDTVLLAYRDVPFQARPYASGVTWERNNVWPAERRSKLNVYANTDVHANVPADATVAFRKDVMFFGACGTVEEPDKCVNLAETNKTQTDDKVWQPPIGRRGELSRMVLYMGLRYYEETISSKKIGLELVDCPPFEDNQYGYLSQLIQWHLEEPASAEEKERNTKACSTWQGNRNPFIDYKDLVVQLYGPPDTIKEGTLAYSRCFEGNELATATTAPTASPNACSDTLEAGDVQVFLTNSDSPDQMGFFTLRQIYDDVGHIYATTRPWDGTKFVENGEGTVRMAIPQWTEGFSGQSCNGICRGGTFSYGFHESQAWERVPTGGSFKDFSLSSDGDTILLYCMNADGHPHFLNGYTFAEGGWAEPGLSADEYGTARSALPEALKTQGSVALPHFNNYVFAADPRGKTRADLLTVFANASNYMGRNDQRWDIPVLNQQTSGALSRTASLSALCTAAFAGFAVIGAQLL